MQFPVGFIPGFVVLSDVTNKVTALTCVCRNRELLLLNCLEAASLSNVLLLPELSAQNAYFSSSSLTEGENRHYFKWQSALLKDDISQLPL